MRDVTILDVARYIREQYKGELTAMKLQKLCYYSQAWSLAWYERPLFEEDFQAWANGPVCPDLYTKHRGKLELETSFLEGCGLSERLNPSEKEVVDIILRDYGDKTPRWLSELTHMERPWLEARGSVPLGEICDHVISKSRCESTFLNYSASGVSFRE